MLRKKIPLSFCHTQILAKYVSLRLGIFSFEARELKSGLWGATLDIATGYSFLGKKIHEVDEKK